MAPVMVTLPLPLMMRVREVTVALMFSANPPKTSVPPLPVPWFTVSVRSASEFHCNWPMVSVAALFNVSVRLAPRW